MGTTENCNCFFQEPVCRKTCMWWCVLQTAGLLRWMLSPWWCLNSRWEVSKEAVLLGAIGREWETEEVLDSKLKKMGKLCREPKYSFSFYSSVFQLFFVCARDQWGAALEEWLSVLKWCPSPFSTSCWHFDLGWWREEAETEVQGRNWLQIVQWTEWMSESGDSLLFLYMNSGTHISARHGRL